MDSTLGGADLRLDAQNLFIRLAIENDAQLVESVENGLAHVESILSDAAGEGNDVGAAEFDEGRAQVSTNIADENFEREFRARVALIAPFGDIANVAAHAAQTEKSALRRERLQQLVERNVHLLH